MRRRFFLHSAATLAACAWTMGIGMRQARAQGLAPAAFPLRPIRLVIAFPAGGPTDGMVRILAANAASVLGQPVVVDNRPGAGGGLPLQQLQAAPADGYTLAQLPVGVARASPSTAAYQGADDDDVVPVIHVTGYSLGLSVAPDSPLIGGNGLADWARASLGRLLYGPDSAPLTLELVAEKLRQRARQLLQPGGTSLLDAPQPSRPDLAGAQPGASPAHPTLGLGLIYSEPFGIGAPRGTPAAVVRRLREAFAHAMAQPNFRQALRHAGAP